MRVTSSNRSKGASRRYASAPCARLRAQGLRRVELWVPDMHSTRFAAARFRTMAQRQSARAAIADDVYDDQLFVENLADWDE
ncbi:antitoxin MazE-like protein [Sandaracinobacteroides hominis]|uniref:antitoxin MazE-like protein n=1 Tax=Sandaracinobacteroides hominis TaxID=2780086 RepID=UPI0022A7E9F2|nr:antitoxin MazE-like protein [Sandaracinobacteroides hominis]